MDCQEERRRSTSQENESVGVKVATPKIPLAELAGPSIQLRFEQLVGAARRELGALLVWRVTSVILVRMAGLGKSRK